MDQYIGRLLDNRYEILEIIGTGGMAVVYKARCHRLNRLVAIKILKDEYSRDEEFRRRFHHEGEAVAMLSHPNIVQVYDVSSTNSADFIVMELIDGITLKQYMEKKGTLNWKETLHFSMQIGKALEHAHGRGIVHRDIKPHNVMVLKNGSVKVTDFGIARVMSKSNTLTKEALGSVHYISPEQAKGGWVDNRSDLYSLSVVMYEMMTGRPPYDGETPVSVAIQHINGGAMAPSVLNPNIPKGLEQIIQKGMALDAKDRYVSATEMLQDMDEFRKDPMIIFEMPVNLSTEPTQKLDTQEIMREARKARTTAEKVAGAGTGVKSRTASDQKRQQDAARVRAAAQQRAQSGTQIQSQIHTMQPLPRTTTREQIRQEIRQEERNRMATIAVVVCSAVAIIAIIIFLVLLVNGVLFNKGDTTVAVPNLVGEYYSNVRDIQGLNITVGDYQHSDTVDKDKIISQKPAYGAKVVQGTKVTVVLSLGPEPEVKILDNLAMMDLENAQAYLTRMGMNPVPKYEFNETVEKGRVIRTDPAQGTELTDGQTVWLICSSGPVIEKAEMPKLVGKSFKEAKAELEKLGFNGIISYTRKESDEPRDEVIEQPYKRGTMVDITEDIELVISKGPRPTEPPEEDPTEAPAPQPTEAPKPKPTEAPTPPPTEAPTEKPTDPPVVDKTKTVTIALPTDRTEDYVLGLFLNGKSVLEATAITAGTPSIDVTLTGKGTVYYDLYINDTYFRAEKVDFS